MSEIFFQYLAIALAVGLVLYGVGCVIFLFLRFQPKNVFTSVFLKLFAGCFSFTAICALYFTTLKTIFSGLIICVLYFCVECRLNKKKIPNYPIKIRAEAGVVLLFLVVIMALFAYRFRSITYDGHQVLNIPNTDFSFYARISYYVVNSGIESATPTQVFQELNARNPYHYFDIWFNGAISFFSSGDNLQILFLVSYTIGISLVWIAFCALAETLDKLTFFNLAVAFLGIFFLPLQSFVSQAINQFLNQLYILTHAPPPYLAYGLWNFTKTYPIYLVLIASALFFLKNHKGLALSILSTLPFIYTTVAIPMMLSLSVYIIVDYFFGAKDKAFFLRAAAFLGCIYLFILGFYFPYLTDSVGTQLDPFRRVGVEPIYKTIFRPAKIFVDATLQLIILLMPFLILIGMELFKRKSPRNIGQTIVEKIKHNSYVQFSMVLYVSALISWCILFDIIDANQFFVTTAIVMVNILCFIVAIHLRMVVTKVFLLLLCAHFVIITNDDIFEQRLYSPDYMSKVEDVVATTGNISGFLLGEKDYEHGYGNNVVEVLGDYATQFRPDMYYVNLSIPDSLTKVGIFDVNVENILADNDFYRFISMQKKNNTFSSIVESRNKFIDEFNIQCVFASPHVVLDSLFEIRVKERISDPYSGQVLLLLTKGDR